MIAGYGNSYCDLSLVNQARQYAQEYEEEGIIFVGHSLGGTAAFCLTSAIPNSRSVSLNPGAAPTNPVITGPGPRATVYHIVGDIISSHMSPNAANVIRIKKPDSVFGSVRPHDSTNILGSSGPWEYYTADEEDELWERWNNKAAVRYIVRPLGRFFNFLTWLKYNKSSEESPIPGSIRWDERYPDLS